MSFISFWNGAWDANGASNLTYCNQGAFGTMATKNAANYTPVDNLLSDSSSIPLSAKQGKVLDGKITNINNRRVFSATEPTTVEVGKIVMVYE